ncbi:hypothetical protein [Mycobacterium sp.]|uniref:hypothetical protein n=1 Tax=Mycobacterium sp. TaxID=1785 RepID=UPI003F987497
MPRYACVAGEHGEQLGRVLPRLLGDFRAKRADAHHVAVKLRTVDCDIAPLHDWEATEFTFGPDEIEKLAVAENDPLKARTPREWLDFGKTLDKEATSTRRPRLCRRLLPYGA